MKKITLVLLLFVVSCRPTPTTTANRVFHVALTGSNTGDGSATSPWRNIGYAAEQLRAGDTLNIHGGLYTDYTDRIDNETSPLGGTGYTISSGTDYNAGAITIQANPGEMAIIQPVDRSGIRLIANRSYIIFKDLIIDGVNCPQPDGGPNLVYLSGSTNHIRFQNMEVKNNGASGYMFSSNNGSADHNEIIGGSSHNNGTRVKGNSGYGIYLSTSDNLIEGVDFYANNGYGVHLNANSNTGNNNRIIRNKIHNNTNSGSGASAGGTTSYGVVIMGADPGPLNNLIANNLIYENQGGVSIYSRARGTKVFNNTITANPGHQNGGEAAIEMQYYYEGNIIQNNIIYANRTNVIRVWQNEAVMDYTGPAVPPTFAADHNLFTDPSFTNAAINDYTLQPNSAAKGAGVTLAEVPNDYTGAMRVAPYDIGAYKASGGVIPPPVNGSISGNILLTPQPDGTYKITGTGMPVPAR